MEAVMSLNPIRLTGVSDRPSDLLAHWRTGMRFFDSSGNYWSKTDVNSFREKGYDAISLLNTKEELQVTIPLEF